MFDLHLVRHGESTWNTLGLAQGHNDLAELTSRGLRQAAETAARFSGHPVRALYASDLRRARQTAAAFAGVLGLPVFADGRLRELLARVSALLRRAQPPRQVLGYADLTLDLASRTVTRDETMVSLTKIEFALLELLLRNAEQVLSYDVILDRVWGYGEAPASNALQVFVGMLRRKLEEHGEHRLVHNVRGVGYVLRAGT